MTESWIDGFNKAVGSYLVAQDFVWNLSAQSKVYNPLGQHIIDGCSVDKIENVSQDIESSYSFDTFDPDSRYPTSYISAEISCACGQFVKARITEEAVITDIIKGVTRA